MIMLADRKNKEKRDKQSHQKKEEEEEKKTQHKCRFPKIFF